MKSRLNINESFICRIWEGGAEFYSDLVADSGEEVEVIVYGNRNYDAGPDYKDAKVKVGGKVYTGDIEIHCDYRNWAEHEHQKDRRYNSVVLHVVMWDSHDKTPPKLRIKRDLPTVILANHLKRSIHDIWQEIISKPSDKFRLPCHDKTSGLSNEIIEKWFDKLAIERLKLKSRRYTERLKEIDIALFGGGKVLNKKEQWEQLLFEFIFEALGFSKNKEQMLKLAGILNLKRLKKYGLSEIIELQSILLGTSGLLFDVKMKDDYIDKIKANWRVVESELKIEKLARADWSFFRLRPQNFPTVRLAYGAQLIMKILKDDLFRKVIVVFESKNFRTITARNELRKLMEPLEDKYWEFHYDFGKISKSRNNLLGSQRIADIIINVIIPVVFLYSNVFKIDLINRNVLKMFCGLKISPDNSILRVINEQVLKDSEIVINSPALEQAAIQLYNFYCTRDRCGECAIGKSIKNMKGFEYRIIYY